MKPTDLRTELSARAAESEGHTYGDLLPGVQRKIRRTKQRRVGTALAGTAAVAALAIGVLPNLDTTTTPDPANTTPIPQDVIRNGIRFDAELDGRALQGAGVGNTGETRMSFEWTPATKEVIGYTLCSTSSGAARNLRVSVNGIVVGGIGCVPGDVEPHESFALAANDALWTQVRPGTKARVDLMMVDLDGRPVRDAEAVLAAGFYTGAPAAVDAMPTQPPPTGPDDYVKDGIRYRAKIGGDTLVAATIGDSGSTDITFRFTPATDRLSLRWFCLGAPDQQFAATINGLPMTSGSCGGATTDPGTVGGISGLPGQGLANVKAGQVNTARLRLTDRKGTPVSVPAARIGFAVYQLGPQRLIEGDGDRLGLDEIKEYAGHLYRLGDVRTAAATAKSVQVATPAGVPFLVAYGSTDTGNARTRVQLDGLDDQSPGYSHPFGAGQSLGAQAGRGAGTATLRVTEGNPTKGKLVVAVYTPVR